MTLSLFQKRFTFLYVIIAMVDLGAVLAQDMFPYLRFFTKPLIMISLLVIYLISLWKFQIKATIPMIVAIIFSLLGDVFLLFKGDIAFMLGLGSFLIAHLGYIVVFIKDQKMTQYEKGPVLRRRPGLIAPFGLYTIILLVLLWSDLGALKIPVVIYSLTIMMMGLTALNRWRYVHLVCIGWVMTGALLFIISDSLIAINKFLIDFPLSGFWIMLTYIVAQYCLIMGITIQYEQWAISQQKEGVSS